MSLYTSGFVFAVTFPCNVAVLRGKVCDTGGWKGFVNRHLFIPLPVFLITFTHQFILSEFLWSKNKNSVFRINVQSSLSNVAVWTVGTLLLTVWSRKYLTQMSRTYRLLMWDYTRTHRDCANKWFPTVFGRITNDLDWYNILFMLSMYHIVWGMVSAMLEKGQGAHYAMFYRDSTYSKWCSPRWREWREKVVRKEVDNKHVVSSSRWGSFITNDRWKVRSDT
ncbi:hypothetical protein AGDE_06630 [Angomonas deanei]|nr:hypothetical protein AGDE_06630 [Angomonas deanei]|eukprot:EPY37304.1 hypothetical protein AGDE_06630 [Angomonas deanei]